MKQRKINIDQSHKTINSHPLLSQIQQKTITVKRSFDEAWYWLGRCYEKLNRNKEAVESYQLALQIDPDYIEAKDALGKLGIKQ